VDEKLFIGVLARLDRNQQGAHMDAKCQYSSIPRTVPFISLRVPPGVIYDLPFSTCPPNI